MSNKVRRSSDAASSPVGAKAALTLIEPLAAPLRGEASVPGDKSISHRAVLFSAMAEGVSQVSGVLDSEDVRSSLAAVSALGAKVRVSRQPDGSLAGSIEGWGQTGPQQPDGPVFCGNSGTTARLLMGVLAPWPLHVELTGDESLERRPMRRIARPLELMGASVLPKERPTLPLTVEGNPDLQPVSYDLPVASAQLKTAVLLAGVFAGGTTVVREPAPSRNHTELMLPEYGVKVEHGPSWARVTGPAFPHAADLSVPGDPSSAAFLVCAAVLKDESDIVLRNVSLSEARIGFARVLQRMGARVDVELESAAGKEPVGSIRARFTPGLRACEVEACEIASLVDEVPVLSLAAARAQGTTVFRGVGELRVKETDRLAAILEGLSKMGVRAWAEGDDLFIEGVPDLALPCGLVFDSRGDHRLAMTWSLAGLVGKAPVTVQDFACVAVSYPGFLDDVRKLAK